MHRFPAILRIENELRSDVEAITPKRFCENELVNLLCSSFPEKAERVGARLTVCRSPGYGCHSICIIARQHKGLCAFEPKGGVFTLRVVLPVQVNPVQGNE